MPNAKLRILLVEDSEWDAKVAMAALRAAETPIEVERVANGPDALQRLRHGGADPAAVKPNLVILDLRMPGMDGHEVLRHIRDDPMLRSTPVLVMANLPEYGHRARDREMQADAYLKKPFAIEDYPAMVQAIVEFWSVRSAADAAMGARKTGPA